MKTWYAVYQFWKTDDGRIYSQHMDIEPFDFCSHAERKEDGTVL